MLLYLIIGKTIGRGLSGRTCLVIPKLNHEYRSPVRFRARRVVFSFRSNVDPERRAD